MVSWIARIFKLTNSMSRNPHDFRFLVLILLFVPSVMVQREMEFPVCGVIPHAAISETSANCWKLSVIRVFSPSAWVVESPSRVSSMAPRKSAKAGWYRP